MDWCKYLGNINVNAVIAGNSSRPGEQFASHVVLFWYYTRMTSEAHIFLGIDGGGSRCRARLRDSQGALLGEGEGGPANIYQDFEGSAISILAAAKAATVSAGLSEARMAEFHAGMGLAGIISSQSAGRLRSQGLPFAALTLINDAHAACLGAHSGGDGGIVIAGTGSAGYVIVDGKGIGIGGWGFELGDDGSGAIMGREAVRRAVLSIDGLGPSTPLTEHILAELGRSQPALTAWSRSAKSIDYARFAPDIFRFSGLGDEAAGEIVAKAVGSVFGMAKRLLQLGAPLLSMLGGLSGPLKQQMSPSLAAFFIEPAADATDGAIMAARQAAGLPEDWA